MLAYKYCPTTGARFKLGIGLLYALVCLLLFSFVLYQYGSGYNVTWLQKWLQKFDTLDADSPRYEVWPMALGINDRHQQKSSTEIHSRPHVLVRLLEVGHP